MIYGPPPLLLILPGVWAEFATDNTGRLPHDWNIIRIILPQDGNNPRSSRGRVVANSFRSQRSCTCRRPESYECLPEYEYHLISKFENVMIKITSFV